MIRYDTIGSSSLVSVQNGKGMLKGINNYTNEKEIDKRDTSTETELLIRQRRAQEEENSKTDRLRATLSLLVAPIQIASRHFVPPSPDKASTQPGPSPKDLDDKILIIAALSLCLHVAIEKGIFLPFHEVEKYALQILVMLETKVT
ncbi:hypothetical protein RRF57_007176 [Xylaria bambusicola]|uniref:Uncharacterized protein n=1 Tax=Xylaria bambusicola TaxID=326684 RepID=A0AAN7Z7C9_9PEZI